MVYFIAFMVLIKPACTRVLVYKTGLYEKLLKRVNELQAELAEAKKEESTS